MKHVRSSHASLLILEKDEELHESLTQFAKDNDLSGAWLSGVGAARAVTAGRYDLEAQEYEWHEYNELLEILNLTGNISLVGNEPVWHIHGVFSDQSMNALGGHVKRLVVGVTCELFITPFETPLTREHDEETGLKLLKEE